MLRVALTGGVGSGKTTAAAIFRELGCFVSQSDEVARGMMQPGEPVYDAIVRTFGAAVVQTGGALDRAALAKLAFVEGRVEELNSIVHPAVIAAQSAWVRLVGAQHAGAVAMIESALIFETRHGSAATDSAAADSAADAAPWRARFDRVVLVTAPEALRLQRFVDRYLARGNGSGQEEIAAAEADARARMRAQMPDEQKAVLSDVVIQNSGSLQDLRRGVSEVWHDLRREAAATA